MIYHHQGPCWTVLNTEGISFTHIALTGLLGLLVEPDHSNGTGLCTETTAYTGLFLHIDIAMVLMDLKGPYRAGLHTGWRRTLSTDLWKVIDSITKEVYCEHGPMGIESSMCMKGADESTYLTACTQVKVHHNLFHDKEPPTS